MHFDPDVIILGAGAAGMMCAIEAGKRGQRVWLVDHAQKIGEKIRISGGGRCNFTNIHAAPEHYLSSNPHFCKSALRGYTPQDFIALVEKHGIAYHEKTLGQLFCDESAQQIITMLLTECHDAGVRVDKDVTVGAVTAAEPGGYCVETSQGTHQCRSVVVATGGLSIPKIGASKFGYDLARHFGMDIVETRPALVPLTFQSGLLDFCKSLTGVSVDARVACGRTSFAEGLLFTHRGLSGPSILQISSYWAEGGDITVNLAPDTDVTRFLIDRKAAQPKQEIHNALAECVPKRLAQGLCGFYGVDGRLADLSHEKIRLLAQAVNGWQLRPGGTEGYRTAEVTLGGVDTRGLSSRTMESQRHPGLYFIGEVVDVTGHLGGYNFQWAWASGYAAGQVV